MNRTTHNEIQVPPAAAEFYRTTMNTLRHNSIPFLIGGAYALEWHTSIPHRNKDLDILVQPADCPRALETLQRAGYRTEMTFSHWLGKAFSGEEYIDLIFNSGNGILPVDDEWFKHSVPGRLLDHTVEYCSAIDLIWSKAFVMERERFDGADIMHLIRVYGTDLDWSRLLRLFGPHWRVLFSHLALFGFVFPTERNRVPDWVMRDLTQRLNQELDTNAAPSAEPVCQGTLLSREQYLIDICHWGYLDARLRPQGNMTHDEIERWTMAAFAPNTDSSHC